MSERMDRHIRDMALEETGRLRDALAGGDGAGAAVAMGRLSSLLPRVMPGFLAPGRAGRGRAREGLTPLWIFVQPMLERLRIGEWTSRSDVNEHIEARVELTAADLEPRARRSGAVIPWKYDTLWLKLLLKLDGLVEDNGRRGPASRWRLTRKGAAMGRRMGAGAQAERIAREWYIPAEAAFRGRDRGGA